MKIRKIWLLQPLAFARVGVSKRPLQAFRWTEPDLRPNGTGRTSIVPSADEANSTLFRDEHGIRPVCPYFELHGEFDPDPSDREHSTLITHAVLSRFGLGARDIEWSIKHANLKAYALTRNEGDRIEAELRFAGDDYKSHELEGHSPNLKSTPLVPVGSYIPMGAAKAVSPTNSNSAIRLRFHPPAGKVYGPTDLKQRLALKREGLDELLHDMLSMVSWDGFDFDGVQQILKSKLRLGELYEFLPYQQILGDLPRILRTRRI